MSPPESAGEAAVFCRKRSASISGSRGARAISSSINSSISGLAETFYRRAISIRESSQGNSHPDVVVALENLAVLLRTRNKNEEAAEIEARVIAVRSAAAGNSNNSPGGTLISGGVLTGRAVVRQQPVYPVSAMRARATGTVTVEIIVDESGSVISARAVSGHSNLRRASEDAARRWRFTPTVLEGRPVRTSGTISFNFNLQ